jgi:hypothetical protein
LFLKIEALDYSETLVSFFSTIWRHIPEDSAPISTIVSALGNDEKLQVTAFNQLITFGI